MNDSYSCDIYRDEEFDRNKTYTIWYEMNEEYAPLLSYKMDETMQQETTSTTHGNVSIYWLNNKQLKVNYITLQACTIDENETLESGGSGTWR